MTGKAKSPIGRLLRRHAEQAISEALEDTRVVLVNGARQSGKSTLLRQTARGDTAEWRDLDSPAIRQAALADPVGFVDYSDMMVIDEIQRVPELLLPIKVQVDNDARPGRTCSPVRPGYSGSVPFRTRYPAGWRPSNCGRSHKGEIDEAPDGFIDAIFARQSGRVCRPNRARRLPRGDSAIQPAAARAIP
jgi:uncharacterized protein